jgi:VanZ family protein
LNDLFWEQKEIEGVKKLLRWLSLYSVVCVVYMVVLFVLSTSPTEIEVESFSAFDKLVHVGAYGVLAVLIYLGLQRSGVGKGYLFVLSFLGSFAYGIVNEVQQAFLPWRDADLADVAANGIGAVCFLLALTVARRAKTRNG